MKEAIANHSAGIVGASGIIVGKAKVVEGVSSFIPSNPAEWLIFLSTALVLLQLGHYGWRFVTWARSSSTTR